MPYRLEVVEGKNLRAAPSVEIAAGEMKFRLRDSSGRPVAGALIEFHVLYGGGSFRVPDPSAVPPREKSASVVRNSTAPDGLVESPKLILGLEEGPNGILVLARHAALEHIVVATYQGVRLEVISPAPGDRDRVSGSSANVEVKALDSNYRDAPVPSLALEIEVTSGAATFPVGAGAPGHYDLRRTGADGSVRFLLQLNNRSGPVTVSIAGYLHRQIGPATLSIATRPPALLSYSSLSVATSPVSSVPSPVRLAVSDSRDSVISPDDRDLPGLFGFFEEPNRVVEVHPPASALWYELTSVLLLGTTQGDYRVRVSLPDFPDTPALEAAGSVRQTVTGPVPRVTTPGPLGNIYVESYGGGNYDPDHKLRAAIIDGALQYLGPNATTPRPTRLNIEVLPPTGPRRLVEARFRFKLRTTPFNSSVDDLLTNPNVTAGQIGRTPSGPWADEIVIPVTGTSGSHRIDVFFRSNEQNFEHLIDVTAETTMEDIDANGNLFQFDEPARILLRAAILQPRIYFVRRDGADFVPVTESGIRPVTVQDAQGNLVSSLPMESAFYVQMRCHDVGPTLICELRTGVSDDIELQRIEVNPQYALYRSKPCFVYVDDPTGGGPPVDRSAFPDTELIHARPGQRILARVSDQMPNNTRRPDPIFYSTGRRPISGFYLLGAGDSASRDRPPRPTLHVQVKDDATWPVNVAASGRTVDISLTVHDPVADLGGPAPASVEINGQTYPLQMLAEAKSHGRPNGWSGHFSGSMPVDLGMQLVTIKVTNALDQSVERRFVIDVQEGATAARVRPIGGFVPPLLPYFQYLYAEGTWLGPGVNPPSSFPAAVEGLGPFPSTAVAASLSLALEQVSPPINDYASPVFLTVREDLRPAAPMPVSVLPVPLGGRVQWSTAALPNALGKISLSNRTEHRTQITAVERKRPDGAWENATRVWRGDVLRVVARTYPGDSAGTSAQIEVSDPNRRPVQGLQRRADLNLERVGPGSYEMSSYFDEQFQQHAAREITVLAPHDPAPPGRMPLRLYGHGRLLAGEAVVEGSAEIDIPAGIKPERVAPAGGQPLDQEPLRSQLRLGAMASVVPGTGEVVHGITDRWIPSRGFDAHFLRAYRSGNAYPGPLGQGWNPSWNVFLWRESAGEMRLLEGDGRIVTFRQTGTGWEPSPGFYGLLEERQGGYRLHLPAGRMLVFLPVGESEDLFYPLVSHRDRFGNRVVCIYPHHGRLAVVVDTLGRSFSLGWDDRNGRILFLGDYGGSEVVYKMYGPGDPEGEEGNLASVRSPTVANPDNPFPNGRIWTYGYYSRFQHHQLKWIQDGDGNARSLSPLLEMTYHPGGHIHTQSYGRGTFTFTPGPGELGFSDRKTQPRRIEFLQPGLPGFARQPSRIIVTVGGRDLAHSFDHNTQGEVRRHERPRGNATETDYDETAADPRDRGNVREIRELPDGSRPTIVTRTMGATDFRSDPVFAAIDRLVETRDHEPGLQLVRLRRDAAQREWVSVYVQGFLQRYVLPSVTRGGLAGQPQQRMRRYEWNRAGQLIWFIEENGVATRFWYYPEKDPMGLGGSLPVSSPGRPGGFLAAVETDVPYRRARRASHLAPLRTVRVDFGYDEYGNRSRVTDSLGWYSLFWYNELGEVILRKGPQGETDRFRYDASGRLSEKFYLIADLGFPLDIPAQSPETLRDKYEFDREGRMEKLIIDADGLKLTTRWEFDENGNLRFCHSPLANAATDRQEFNRIERVYDEAGRFVQEIHGSGSSSPISWEYVYDDNGDLEELKYPTGVSRIFIRDGFGRLVAEGDPLGNSHQFHLDDAGNVTRVVVQGSLDGDPGNIQVLYDAVHYVDEADRVVASRERAFRFLEGSAGLLEERIGSGERIEESKFDAAGHQLQHLSAAGLVTTTEIDGHGLPVRIYDNLGTEVRFEYDSRNSARKIIQTDPLGTSTVVRVPDAAGRIVEETGYKGVVYRHYYDTLGRLRLREDALGNRVRLDYDHGGRQDHTVYYMYQDGRRVNPDGTENPLVALRLSDIKHDANGNVREVRDSLDQVALSFEYYETNMPKTQTLPEDKFVINGTVRDDNPGAESYQCTYRGDGLLESVTDPEGRVVRCHYDAAGRISRQEVEQGTAPDLFGTTEVTFLWDGAGRLVEAKDNNGISNRWVTAQRRYTSMAGLSREKLEDGLGAVSRSAELAVDYLADGRPSLLYYPNSNRVIGIVPNPYGDTLRVIENVSGHSYADYGYVGRWFSYRTYANGVSYGFGYDANKEVLEIRSYTGTDFSDNANLRFGHRYGYDALGIIKRDVDLMENRYATLDHDSHYRLTALVQGYDPNDPAVLPRWGQWWQYDALGNPEQLEGGGITGRDPQGNLLHSPDSLTINVFNAANQMGQKSVRLPAQRTEDFHYDRRGNLRQDAENDYHYDYKNRLVEVISRSGSRPPVRFYYDALDRRVRKDETQFVWWAGNLLEEHPDGAAWFRRYIYGARPGELIAYETNRRGRSETFFIHAEQSGSVAHLTTDTGQIVEKYGYQPFGAVEVQDAAGNPQDPAIRTGFPFLMNQHYYDEEVSLYSVGPRVYHPFLGRFMQRDPAGALASPLSRLNPYVYGTSNPRSFADDGLSPILVGAGLYLLGAAVLALLETGVEAGTSYALFGDETQFSAGRAFGRNLVVGLLTNWIPGAAEARWGTKIGARVGAHAILAGAETAVEYSVERFAFGSDISFWAIGIGNIIGEGVSFGVGSRISAIRRARAEREFIRLRAMRYDRRQARLELVLRERARRLGIPEEKLIIGEGLPYPFSLGGEFAVVADGMIHVDRRVWMFSAGKAGDFEAALPGASDFRTFYPRPGAMLSHEAAHLLLDATDNPGVRHASQMAIDVFFKKLGLISPSTARVLERSVP